MKMALILRKKMKQWKYSKVDLNSLIYLIGLWSNRPKSTYSYQINHFKTEYKEINWNEGLLCYTSVEARY